ncbi:MAG: DUF1501 domain-containing protein, partial [Pirellulaceae bacterium]
MLPSDSFSRRRMLQTAACGFGGLALADMLHAATGSQTVRGSAVPPKARRVIFLFMAGGPSQHDLFDPK